MNGGSIFEQCYQEHDGEQERILWCIANYVETTNAKSVENVNQWLLILAGSFVFFMQGGFAMLCAGAVRRKNVSNTLLKNLLDAIGAAVAFATIGYGFAYGNGNGFIGGSEFFLKNADAATFFFQYGFSAAAVTIVAGTLAERCKMVAYLCYSFFLTGFVYPVICHVVWSDQGYFSRFNSDPVIGSGMIDFAGSGVVHVTGGSVALYATLILGPRRGRFYDKDGKKLKKPGLSKINSIALQALGVFMLWFGWYGFNCGSALIRATSDSSHVAAIAAVNTTISAAIGGICAMITDAKLVERKTGDFNLDITRAINGALAGLVASTGGCGVVDHWAACVIGLISGWLYLFVSKLLIRLEIDDAIEAIPVHLPNGILGVLTTGLFASPEKLTMAYGEGGNPGLFYGDATLLGSQAVGLLFILMWNFVTMYPFFTLLNRFKLLRVCELEEIVGLDATYNDSSLNEDQSDTDAEIRAEAYKKRFEEKQEIRKKKTMKDVDAMPWGDLDLEDSSNKSRKNAREVGDAIDEVTSAAGLASWKAAYPEEEIGQKSNLLQVLSLYQ